MQTIASETFPVGAEITTPAGIGRVVEIDCALESPQGVDLRIHVQVAGRSKFVSRRVHKADVTVTP